MMQYLEIARILITVCLAAAVAWQIREIKNLNQDKSELHRKIVESNAEKIILESRLKSAEEQRDEANYKIISMTKALSDFKKSLKVK